MNEIGVTVRIRRIAAIAALSVGLASGLAACGSDDAVGTEATLRINTGFPATHHFRTNLWDPWKEFVEEETDGAVKVEVYDGDTLGTLNSALSDLSGGVYDATIVSPPYFMDTSLFIFSIGGLAHSYPDIDTGNAVLAKYAEKNAELFEIEGVRLVDFAVTDQYQLFGKKPFKSPDALQGLQVRVQSPSQADLVKAWGANPVQIATGETYQALERGTVDVAPYTIVGDMGQKFHEVAPYVTMVDTGGSVSAPSISQKFLDGLSTELQEIFEDSLLPKLAELNQQTYSKEIDKAQETLKGELSDEGVVVVDLTDNEVQKFRDAAKVQWDAWIKEADKKGFDGDALVDEWVGFMESEGADAPFGKG